MTMCSITGKEQSSTRTKIAHHAFLNNEVRQPRRIRDFRVLLPLEDFKQSIELFKGRRSIVQTSVGEFTGFLDISLFGGDVDDYSEATLVMIQGQSESKT